MGRRKYLAEEEPPYEVADTTLTTKQLLGFLRKRHSEYDKWVYVEELTTATGSADATRIDAWAMHCWPSARHERIAYEVKVSRGDYLREMKTPGKRKYAMMFSNLFYFVTPRKLVSPEEVPAGCGLMEYNADGRLYTRVSAPYRESTFPTWGFLAAVTRRTRAEADPRAVVRLAYEYEYLKNFEAVKKADIATQQARADVITKTARALDDAVHEARREIDKVRREMGVEPIQWREIAKAATTESERERAAYHLGGRF